MNKHARELEKLIEKLLCYSFEELSDENTKFIYNISGEILELKQFFDKN